MAVMRFELVCQRGKRALDLGDNLGRTSSRWIPAPESVSANQSARAGELAAEYDDQYDLAMERITATLEPETLRQIRRVAGPRGVSKFLSMAARERLARLELLGLLDELDAKHGAPEKAVTRKVKRDAPRIFRR